MWLGMNNSKTCSSTAAVSDSHKADSLKNLVRKIELKTHSNVVLVWGRVGKMRAEPTCVTAGDKTAVDCSSLTAFSGIRSPLLIYRFILLQKQNLHS